MSKYHCASCETPVNPIDRYCAICGHDLVQLTWFTQKQEDQKVEEFFPVAEHMSKIRLKVKNTGSVPAALHFDSDGMDGVPPWIISSSFRPFIKKTVNLEPTESSEWTIYFDQVQLNKIMQILDRVAPGEKGEHDECVLPFWTTGVVTKEQDWEVEFTLPRLVLSREPFASPEILIHRFLSWEQLQTEVIEHKIKISNQTESPIDIYDI
ncbi:MAG: hypothetical protein VX278_18645, partial [Myxococcota bacterium]|nr:hypothetical protein [Myxococcota bacterium]